MSVPHKWSNLFLRSAGAARSAAEQRGEKGEKRGEGREEGDGSLKLSKLHLLLTYRPRPRAKAVYLYYEV